MAGQIDVEALADQSGRIAEAAAAVDEAAADCDMTALLFCITMVIQLPYFAVGGIFCLLVSEYIG